jgi:hypothetical protein
MISSFGYLAYSPSPTLNPTTAMDLNRIPKVLNRIHAPKTCLDCSRAFLPCANPWKSSLQVSVLEDLGFLAFHLLQPTIPPLQKDLNKIPTKVYLCLRLTKFGCCWSNCSTSGRDKGVVVTTPIISSEFQKYRMGEGGGGDMLACAAAAAGSPSRRKKECTF